MIKIGFATSEMNSMATMGMRYLAYMPASFQLGPRTNANNSGADI